MRPPAVPKVNGKESGVRIQESEWRGRLPESGKSLAIATDSACLSSAMAATALSNCARKSYRTRSDKAVSVGEVGTEFPVKLTARPPDTPIALLHVEIYIGIISPCQRKTDGTSYGLVASRLVTESSLS